MLYWCFSCVWIVSFCLAWGINLAKSVASHMEREWIWMAVMHSGRGRSESLIYDLRVKNMFLLRNPFSVFYFYVHILKIQLSCRMKQFAGLMTVFGHVYITRLYWWKETT